MKSNTRRANSFVSIFISLFTASQANANMNNIIDIRKEPTGVLNANLSNPVDNSNKQKIT